MNLFAISGLLIGLASLIFGLLVYLNNKTNKANIFWFIFCISVAAWGFGGFKIGLIPQSEMDTALFWWRATHIGIIFIPIFFLNFIYEWLKIKKDKIFYFFYIQSFVFLILNLSDFIFNTEFFIGQVTWLFNSFYYDTHYTLDFYWPFVFLWTFAVIYAHYLLFKSYQKVTGLKKTQIKLFLIAFIISYAGGATSYLPALGINIYPVLNIFVIFYPIMMAYAIVRHRFLGIHLIANKIYTYITTGVFFIASFSIYHALVIYNIKNTFFTYTAILSILIIALICAIIFIPLLNIIQKSSDDIFGQNPQKAIKDLIIKLSTIIKTDQIISKIGQEFKKILKTKGVYVVIAASQSDSHEECLSVIRQLKNNNKKSKNKSLKLPRQLTKSEQSICAKLSKTKELIIRDEIQTNNNLSKHLDNFNIKIISPFISSNRVIGILILSEKINKEAYTKEEIEFLQVICPQVATAIENSLLHKELNKKIADQTIKITKQNNEITIKNKQLYKLLNAKSDFIKIVSHQLRTPIGVIKSVLNMIKEGQDLKNQEGLMQGVFVKSMKISEVIEEMIYAFDLESERFNVNQEATDIIKVTEAAILNPKKIAEESDIKFIFEVPKEKLLPIFASKEHLEKVISILANNAVTYNKKGGSVEVKISQDQKQTKIIVSDTGHGLSKKYLKNIFQPFMRDIDSDEFDTDKSGLGLYLAKKIIDSHKDSNIKLIKTNKKGTTFEVILPTLTKEYMIRK